MTGLGDFILDVLQLGFAGAVIAFVYWIINDKKSRAQLATELETSTPLFRPYYQKHLKRVLDKAGDIFGAPWGGKALILTTALAFFYAIVSLTNPKLLLKSLQV